MKNTVFLVFFFSLSSVAMEKETLVDRVANVLNHQPECIKDFADQYYSQRSVSIWHILANPILIYRYLHDYALCAKRINVRTYEEFYTAYNNSDLSQRWVDTTEQADFKKKLWSNSWKLYRLRQDLAVNYHRSYEPKKLALTLEKLDSAIDHLIRSPDAPIDQLTNFGKLKK